MACFSGFAQETKWKQVRELKFSTAEVRIDQLNNLYLIKKGEVIKTDQLGKVLTRYSNKLIGDNVHLDVSNPMKVLLFAPDQMKVVFLDSRLGELREEINLYNEGFEQISLAASSHSNGFWLYDPINFKLMRYDQHFKKERESLNIAQMLRVEFFPVSMLEADNKLYLSDPNHGIFVFDVYGNYVRRIPLKGIERLLISDQRLFFMKGARLYALGLIDGREEEVLVGGAVTGAFDMNRNMICVVGKQSVIIFEPEP